MVLVRRIVEWRFLQVILQRSIQEKNYQVLIQKKDIKSINNWFAILQLFER